MVPPPEALLLAMTLSPKQRSRLKSLAHHLKPVHHVGREGVTEAALAAIMEAFNQKELIKVKVLQSAEATAAETGHEISERLSDIEHVQTIGRTIVLYRRHPEKPGLDVGEI